MTQIRTIPYSGSVPTINQLPLGDIAINTYDSRLYYKRVQGTNQKVIGISNALAYGQWQNNTTLTGSANVSQSFQYDTTDLAYKTYLQPPDKLYVEDTGVYNLQFSAQLEEPAGGDATIYIWLKKNGVNVLESAGAIDLANKGKVVVGWNFMTSMNAGDYLEITWQSNNNNTEIIGEPASGNIPAIPSVIATLTQIY